MSETTGSSYTHAAICIGERQAAGATFSGVTIEPVGELVAAFDHVAARFILTGIVEPSAAIVYDPSIVAPGELGADATWGYFVGYVASTGNYEVPADDEFYQMTPLDDADERY